MPQIFQSINIHDAKTNLSRIVDDVKRLGTPVIIAKSGKPQVKIVPLDEPVISRFGFLAKQTVPDDFDDMYADEISQMFGTDK